MSKIKMGVPVTLFSILKSKEQRVSLQKKLINQYSLPIISLTIIMPGDVKLNSYSLFLFNNACRQIENYCINNNITCVKAIKKILNTGPEAFFLLNQDEKKTKNDCVNIEQSHPLGRLWDIDVISTEKYESISRINFNYPKRKCLICNNDAKACARNRTHKTSELINRIKAISKENGYIDTIESS